jgi:glucose-6-phosphate isomerase
MSAGLDGFLATLGPAAEAARATLARLDREGFVKRLWARDPALWKAEAEHQRVIRNRLGWLDIIEPMRREVGALRAFADDVREAGLTHALLLGMGGSSLAPDVLRLVFGGRGLPDRALDLRVLDSTDPAAVEATARALPLDRTLLLVSTKSGTTTETLAFYAAFRQRLETVLGDRAGRHCVAITDPGTPLERLAREQGFRHTFLNAADIGGRYSALTYVGLVPAALLGLDLSALLARAEAMASRCGADVPPDENEGLRLGVALAELARAGRDKVTFLLSPGVAPFAAWVEQLLAESTGKEGRGLIPVADETPGPPAVYGGDRVFVVMGLAHEAGPVEYAAGPLAAAGHPVLRLTLADRADLAGEFFRCEFATAVAGALLGIDPFDEPNVQESKDNTSRLLDEYVARGRLPTEAPTWQGDGLAAYVAAGSPAAVPRDLPGLLAAHLRQLRRGHYLALMAYVAPTEAHSRALQAFRHRLRDQLHVATTLGYGPRFLHSTGQLHKGGPRTGCFLQITADDAADHAIPGRPYSFGILKQAQALGDLGALRAKGLPVLRLHLSGDVGPGLQRLIAAAEAAALAPIREP